MVLPVVLQPIAGGIINDFAHHDKDNASLTIITLGPPQVLSILSSMPLLYSCTQAAVIRVTLFESWAKAEVEFR